MKTLIAAAALLSMSVAALPAHAIGCVSGAAVGGVAGHVAGHHGLLGAAAGCAIGHHKAVMNNRAKASNAAASQTAAPNQQ